MATNDVDAGCVIWLQGVMAFMEAEFTLWLEKCFKAGELFANWPTLAKMVWPNDVGRVNVNLRALVRLYKDALAKSIAEGKTIMFFMTKYLRNLVGILAQVKIIVKVCCTFPKILKHVDDNF